MGLGSENISYVTNDFLQKVIKNPMFRDFQN